MSKGTAGARSALQPRRPMEVGRIEKAKDARSALKRLVPYLLRFKARLALVVCCVLVYTAFGLLGPYLMSRAIDLYVMTKQVEGLALIAALMLAVYFLTNLFQAVSGWIMAAVSQRALKNLRSDLFEHLQKLSLRYFDRIPAGELMSRLTNDIDAINQAVAQDVVSLLAGVLSLGGILTAMFIMNFWLALTSVLVVPLMFWFTRFVAKYTRRGFRGLQKELGSLNGIMEESISGQKVIKAFGQNDSVVQQFEESNRRVFNASVYANSYALLLMPLTGVLGNFFVIVIAGLGGWLALQDLVTVGVIAAFIVYGQNFIHPLRQLANMYNAIQAALAGAERVFEIIDTQPDSDEPDDWRHPEFEGRVKFTDVQFEYRPGVPVIKGLSLEAEAGQIIALVGPTGAGKTTIINLLPRFYELTAGTISIDEREIQRIPKPILRAQLGLVLQDTFLFADTVLENIRYGKLDATDEECIEAAKIADADLFIRQLPDGYQTDLSERAGNLSQGQRQLLAIARAVLSDPRILILDEATSSVDTRTEVRIQNALLRLMKGRTSFVIAHRLSTIRDADQVLVVKDGQIVERGTHDQLLDLKGFYYYLYMKQFKAEAL